MIVSRDGAGLTRERVRGSASTPSRARVSGAASGVRAIGPLLPDSDDADIAWSAHV